MVILIMLFFLFGAGFVFAVVAALSTDTSDDYKRDDSSNARNDSSSLTSSPSLTLSPSSPYASTEEENQNKDQEADRMNLGELMDDPTTRSLSQNFKSRNKRQDDHAYESFRPYEPKNGYTTIEEIEEYLERENNRLKGTIDYSEWNNRQIVTIDNGTTIHGQHDISLNDYIKWFPTEDINLIRAPLFDALDSRYVRRDTINVKWEKEVQKYSQKQDPISYTGLQHFQLKKNIFFKELKDLDDTVVGPRYSYRQSIGDGTFSSPPHMPIRDFTDFFIASLQDMFEDIYREIEKDPLFRPEYIRLMNEVNITSGTIYPNFFQSSDTSSSKGRLYIEIAKTEAEATTTTNSMNELGMNAQIFEHEYQNMYSFDIIEWIRTFINVNAQVDTNRLPQSHTTLFQFHAIQVEQNIEDIYGNIRPFCIQYSTFQNWLQLLMQWFIPAPVHYMRGLIYIQNTIAHLELINVQYPSGIISIIELQEFKEVRDKLLHLYFIEVPERVKEISDIAIPIIDKFIT